MKRHFLYAIEDAENEEQEPYDIQRLEHVIKSIDVATMNAGTIVQTILQDVSDFVGTAEQFDDMTIVIVKKL